MQLTKKDLAKMLVGIPDDAVITIHTGYHLEYKPYWLQHNATYRIVSESLKGTFVSAEFTQPGIRFGGGVSYVYQERIS